MKKSLILIALTVCLSGCTLVDKTDAINQFVHQESVQGMTQENEFLISIPAFHKGPYEGIDDVNVKIFKGPYKDLNATFFVGKSRESSEWEVFFVMIEKDGNWESLPVKLRE